MVMTISTVMTAIEEVITGKAQYTATELKAENTKAPTPQNTPMDWKLQQGHWKHNIGDQSSVNACSAKTLQWV